MKQRCTSHAAPDNVVNMTKDNAARCSWVNNHGNGRCTYAAQAVLSDGSLDRPVCGPHQQAGLRVGWTPAIEIGVPDDVETCDACGGPATTRLAEIEDKRPTGRFTGPCCNPALSGGVRAEETDRAYTAKGICYGCSRFYKYCECERDD